MAKSMVEVISGMTPETAELARLRAELARAQTEAASATARAPVARPTRWDLAKAANGYAVLYLSGCAALALSPPQMETLLSDLGVPSNHAIRVWWTEVRGEANSLYLAHRAKRKAAKAAEAANASGTTL